MDRTHLTRFALLSLAASIVTIALKTLAWYVTGSVGLLSDALESIVNVVAAMATLWLLFLSARPPDERYAYGYSKAEYFASAFEGALILIAAVAIAWTAVERLLHPRAIEQVGLGLAVSVVATVVNFAVARLLLAAARRHDSIALEADGHHLMTDVWTSVGVVVAVFAVAATGWVWLDPVIALAVAVNIVFTGVSLLRRSAYGLMDQALPPERVAADRGHPRALPQRRRRVPRDPHALGRRPLVRVDARARAGRMDGQAGPRPGREPRARHRGGRPRHHRVVTHIEPREDPASYRDQTLDRSTRAPSAT